MKNFWQKLTKPILTTTPMAGITDSAWRQICKSWGADVVHTEFVSVDALCHNSAKTMAMLAYQASEQPVVVQIFGKNAELYPQAAKIVAKTGIAGIDINFGCPAKKVAGHGGGICLLRDLKIVRDIVAKTTAAVDLPVSVKTRIGLRKIQGQPESGNISVFDFMDALKDLPLAALILHGRNYEVPFTGPVDLDMLKEAGEKFKSLWPQGIYLINGSFQTVESVVADLKYTQADGIALSRSLYGRPWLFKQIKDYIQTGHYQEVDWPTIKETAIRHAELLWQSKNEKTFIEMRKHLLFYVKGRPDASELRKKLVNVANPKDVAKILNPLT